MNNKDLLHRQGAVFKSYKINLHGSEYIYILIYITESFRCMLETNKTL